VTTGPAGAGGPAALTVPSEGATVGGESLGLGGGVAPVDGGPVVGGPVDGGPVVGGEVGDCTGAGVLVGGGLPVSAGVRVGVALVLAVLDDVGLGAVLGGGTPARVPRYPEVRVLAGLDRSGWWAGRVAEVAGPVGLAGAGSALS
jgi:hypothetical protein